MKFSALAEGDRARLTTVLNELAACNFHNFAVTGSVGVQQLAPEAATDALNDLDLVVHDVSALPPALSETFLINHFHPDVRRGRILLQLAHPQTALRIDIFTAYGASLSRAVRGDPDGPFLISLEDIAARLGAILMDLDRGRPVTRKYADGFSRIALRIDRSLIEACWREHRQSGDPTTFGEAEASIMAHVANRPELLIAPVYSTDVNATCLDCKPGGSFKCASPRQILAVLGYC